MDQVGTDLPATVRFAPRRVAHGNFFVSDLARSSRFYSEVCGLTLVYREPGIHADFFSNGSSHHDAALMETSRQARVGRGGHVQVPVGRGVEPGLNHVGFEMEDEATLVAAYQRAKAAKVPIHRTADHQISHSVYLFDPEGNYLEMYADASDDWRSVYIANENELLTGVWDPDAGSPSSRPRYDPDPTYQVVPSALVHPKRTSHIALWARELGRLRAFYENIVGLTVVADDASGRFVIMGGTLGGSDLGLFQSESPERRGMHHFGFELADDAEFDQAAERLSSQGVALLSRVESPWKRSMALADPDNLVLEFFVKRQTLSQSIAPESGLLAPFTL